MTWTDQKTPAQAAIVRAERQLAFDRERTKRSLATLKRLRQQQAKKEK